MIYDKRRTAYYNTNYAEPNTTEESVRPVDRYKEEWELKQIQDISSDKQLLEDALGDAAYELSDDYHSAAAAMFADPENIAETYPGFELAIQQIILAQLERNDSYVKHLQELIDNCY
jgi:hypothetical protein